MCHVCVCVCACLCDASNGGPRTRTSVTGHSQPRRYGIHSSFRWWVRAAGDMTPPNSRLAAEMRQSPTLARHWRRRVSRLPIHRTPSACRATTRRVPSSSLACSHHRKDVKIPIKHKCHVTGTLARLEGDAQPVGGPGQNIEGEERGGGKRQAHGDATPESINQSIRQNGSKHLQGGGSLGALLQQHARLSVAPGPGFVVGHGSPPARLRLHQHKVGALQSEHTRGQPTKDVSARKHHTRQGPKEEGGRPREQEGNTYEDVMRDMRSFRMSYCT
jgi:hypothetical protein